MVKVFSDSHRFDDQPSTVLLAFYLRYPNPHAKHVLSCDVISRSIDPVKSSITTQRLILKKGIVPRWARTWLENWGMMGGGGLEAWVLEESEVTIDPKTNQPILTSMTRNISHKKIIHVAESTSFHPASRGTLQKTTAYVSSNFGSGSGLTALVRGRIETYGASRFERNARNAREGMSLILSLLRNYEPLPQTAESSSASPSFLSSQSSPEASSSSTSSQRSYNRTYATRQNVSQSPSGSTSSPGQYQTSENPTGGWARGRRFRYDWTPGEDPARAGENSGPGRGFMRVGFRRVDRAEDEDEPSSTYEPGEGGSSIMGGTEDDPTMRIITRRPETDVSTSNSTSTSQQPTLSASTQTQHTQELPPSFFLSRRNPGLFPDIRERLQSIRMQTNGNGTETGQ